jgi:membrane-associated phospholipid phosphatase
MYGACHGWRPTRAWPTRLLAGVALLLGILFATLTAVVLMGWTYGVDLADTRSLQAVDWGPLQPAFSISDQWDGLRQVSIGVSVILVVFALDRRLGVAALLCAGSGGAWYLLELVTARPRPDAHLVHVVRHAAGGGYPSGHVVFYFWAFVMIAVALAMRLPRRLRFLPGVVAVAALSIVCLGRVVFGEHWPTDVAGGLLLGGAWILGVLWLQRAWVYFVPIIRTQRA